MARGRTEVRDLDGGLGYTGPDGAAIYAVMGVGSKALSVADQRPIIVTSANDVADLIGEGPLRDALVFQLTTTGGTVLAMPLVRSTGGSVLVAAVTSGALAVTAVDGYAFGQQKVRLECTLGGAAGVATFRLIVDGVPAVAFTPDSGDFALAIALTASQLGSLATGVVVSATPAMHTAFAPTITTNAAFVAGEYVEFQMSSPRAAGTDIAPAITKLADTKTLFEWIEIAGVTAPATWALGQTAVRLLRDRGRYVGLHVQAAGPDLLTGASAAVTVPAWVSALIQATVPPRLMAPRLHVWPFHVTMRDPFRNVNRVIPSLYPAVAHMAALEPWEPPDAVEYGELERVIDVYPETISGDNIDALDDAWYATLQEHEGYDGWYITHPRLYGMFPQSGIPGSDFTGTERRRVMDTACRRVNRVLKRRQNGRVATGSDGRMTVAERAAWAGDAVRVLEDLEREGAFSSPRATVVDEAPGILQGGTVVAEIDFIPEGKARADQGIRRILARVHRDDHAGGISVPINGQTYDNEHMVAKGAGLTSSALFDAKYKAGIDIEVMNNNVGSPHRWSLGGYMQDDVTVTLPKAEGQPFMEGMEETPNGGVLGARLTLTFTYSNTDQPDTTDTLDVLFQSVEDTVEQGKETKQQFTFKQVAPAKLGDVVMMKAAAAA